jgi:hypothetical protein
MKESVEVIYNKMREEIRILGWSKILDKYHPDKNIDDPNALKKFMIYKNIYKAMKSEANLAYKNNRTNHYEHQLKIQNSIILNYEKIVNRFFFLSIIIVTYLAIMIILKNV